MPQWQCHSSNVTVAAMRAVRRPASLLEESGELVAGQFAIAEDLREEPGLIAWPA
jgi:hypothetical protein